MPAGLRPERERPRLPRRKPLPYKKPAGAEINVQKTSRRRQVRTRILLATRSSCPIVSFDAYV